MSDDAKRAALSLHEAALAALGADDLEGALGLERRAQESAPSPAYLYQIGRILELTGALGDAYTTYLMARANLAGHPHADDDLRELIADGVDRLESIRRRAVLRLVDVRPDSRVQVEGRYIEDGDDDLVLDPGDHQICFFHPPGRWGACLLRQLREGRRVTVTMPDRFEHLARLTVDPAHPPPRLDLNGRALIEEGANLDVLYLEPGAHTVALRWDAETRTVRYDLVAGEERPIDPAPAIAAQPAAPRSLWDDHPGALVTVGVGAALAITATVLLGLSDGARREVADAGQDADGRYIGISQRDAFARWDDADRTASWGLGLGAAGLAALVAGGLWLALDDDEPAEPAPASDPRAAEGAP